MRTSETINELATALAKAQAEMKNAPEKSKGNFGNYANLATLRDTVTPALTKNNIAVVQATSCTDGKFILVTRLIHQSGQWVEGEYPLANNTDKPQIMGSALTYARRYALAGICNLAPDDDDDDGQKAQDHGNSFPAGNSDIKYYKTAATTPGAVKARDNNAFYKQLEREIDEFKTKADAREWRKFRERDIDERVSPEAMLHLSERYEERVAALP